MEVSSRSINHLVEFGSEEGQPRMKEVGGATGQRVRLDCEQNVHTSHGTITKHAS